jgi:hypothetical protein
LRRGEFVALTLGGEVDALGRDNGRDTKFTKEGIKVRIRRGKGN